MWIGGVVHFIDFVSFGSALSRLIPTAAQAFVTDRVESRTYESMLPGGGPAVMARLELDGAETGSATLHDEAKGTGEGL